MDHKKKIVIIKAAATQYNVDLPEDVTRLIMDDAGTKKELEDSVLRIAVHASLEGCQVTAEVATEVIQGPKDVIPAEPENPGQISSLFEAIEAGDLKWMHHYIRAGSDLEEISDARSGMTPLIVAAELCNMEAMKVLLEAGADPNFDGHTSSSPIHPATVDLECLKVLLEAGADPNSFAEDYFTPLMFVTRDEALPQALLLLESGADPTPINGDGETVLDMAERHGAHRVASLIRRHLALVPVETA